MTSNVYVVNHIKQYLYDDIGIDIEIRHPRQDELIKLPIFLKNSYAYQPIYVNGQDLILAIPKDKFNLSPDQLKKQSERLQHELGARIVFVFERLEAYQRKRLIKKKIAFIVPYKQLYIPFLFIDLNETQHKIYEKREKLRPASQCLLLYHLQVERLNGISFKDIAAKLQYSNMTITRAANELLNIGLAEKTGSRTKSLRLDQERRELWNKSKQLLISPIKEILFVSQLPITTHLYKANQTALEYYTDLAGGRQQTYAIGDEMYRSLKRRRELKDLNNIEGEYALEVWSYDPGLLTNTNLVDPLSLYLSMIDIKDERVEIALDQLLENIKW